MTTPFELGALPALSRSTVNRQESLRGDAERLRARWPKAKVLLVDQTGRSPMRHGETTLALRDARDVAESVPDDALFLGELDDTDYWSVPGMPADPTELVRSKGSWGLLEESPYVDGEIWVELRGHGDVVDDASAGLLTTAVALRNWHKRAAFCAKCGGRSDIVQFGWVSRCQNCGREEYPRTDPAVICLVHDDIGVNGEHVLLARQPTWPAHRYSVLAGFVEAGESLEACVLREIAEEVGLEVRDPRYLGSQPWPFPRSIMLGFAARADASAPVRPADGEIEQARWVSRSQVRAAFAGENAELLLPGNSSIARVMLAAWAEAGN